MNINFHYFAVKSIAVAAGFEETQAQQIAKYSQFVDDYSAPLLMSCSNIPKEITSSGELDLFIPFSHVNFRPVSTGFARPFEYSTLIVRREQRFVLSPFHFVPYDETGAGAASSPVIPLAVGDNSLLDRLLHKEISNKSQNQNIALMRLGMLLHTFADTHAHQRFTGFTSTANRANITGVKNNITGEDCTAQARAGIRGLLNAATQSIPAIGHVQAGHNPDLSHISFSYTGGNGESHFCNNTEIFLEAGRNIFEYLKKYRGPVSNINDNLNSHESHIPDTRDDWNSLAPKLRQGFLVEIPRRDTVGGLAAHWAQLFPGNNYHYDSSEIRQGFRLTPASAAALARNAFSAYSEEFYGYNVMANEILIALYGARPRR